MGLIDHKLKINLSLHIYSNELMRQCVGCCTETDEHLNHVSKGYDNLVELLRLLENNEALERCQGEDVFIHGSCRMKLWNSYRARLREGGYIFSSQ